MDHPSFDVWLLNLKTDAARKGFTQGVERIPDLALKLFWQDGVEASIDGILHGKMPAGNVKSFRNQRRA